MVTLYSDMAGQTPPGPQHWPTVSMCCTALSQTDPGHLDGLDTATLVWRAWDELQGSNLCHHNSSPRQGMEPGSPRSL